MQERIIEILCCPVSKRKLSLITFNSNRKDYNGKKTEECFEGILISETGWMYPIINGVPRMQLDAFLEYSDFLKQNYKDYENRKKTLLNSYYEVIKDATKKTKKTKKSFGQEWAIFKYEGDTTWGFTSES
ncbi:MAG TPA: hypothetical protein VGK25_09065, partial [Ignavibacteria bacterium]